ncbi:MAG: GAF domain-containing protein [Desulfamplus sp.]|nr:GAF domain-containing protein [Desulfamplus sp.]
MTRPTYKEIEERLLKAEAILILIRKGEIDTIDNGKDISFILPRKEMESRLAELTRERTARLNQQNHEHILNEERLRNLLHLSLMKTESKQEILDFALESIVRLTESKLGYLYFFNEDKRRFSRFLWSTEMLENCMITEKHHYSIHMAGIWADSVRKREAVIHNNYPDLTDKKELPEGHFSINRHLSVPVFEDDKIVAVAGVANKSKPYENSDIRQVSLFMATMWSILRTRQYEYKLARAKELAEAANIAKTDFLSNVSHELRTPLNGIYGFLQLIIKDAEKDPPQIDKVIERGKLGLESCRHLIELINDILDFSKIEAGRLDLHMEKIALGSVLDEIESRMHHMAQQKNLKLKISNAFGIPNVMADRKILNQILFNIVGNAIKFTEKGLITISCRQTDENMAEIEVSDTGCGIAQSELHKVFNRFEQATTKMKDSGGTGLGLAISKKLVEMMGGQIKIKSELGKGSTVYFTIAIANT